MLTVYVVSDGTGGTAERMARSALIQFENAPVNLVRRPNVRSAKKLRVVVEEAAAGESLILHTLVSDELRRLMVSETRLHGVDSLDMMGPILDRLARHLKLTPQEKPGLFQQLVEARTREIEAVAFAFRHDDGQNAGDLERAEVVLVGISRTMKTPTMLYLAYRGWFAANVPLVPGIAPPKSLLAVPARAGVLPGGVAGQPATDAPGQGRRRIDSLGRLCFARSDPPRTGLCRPVVP